MLGAVPWWVPGMTLGRCRVSEGGRVEPEGGRNEGKGAQGETPAGVPGVGGGRNDA